MPSHSERVRRNYHAVTVSPAYDVATDERVILIRITQDEIASAISRRELRSMVLKRMSDEIDTQVEAVMPIGHHTHFCWRCFIKRGPKNRRGDRGWWRCLDARCVRANEATCAYHHDH